MKKLWLALWVCAALLPRADALSAAAAVRDMVFFRFSFFIVVFSFFEFWAADGASSM